MTEVKFRLKWKLFLIFGTLAIMNVLITSYFIYTQAYNDYEIELTRKLDSVAKAVNAIIVPEKIAQISSMDDPYYAELKTLFRRFSVNFNLSWLAMYRHNGDFFTHVVDGAERGYEFCLDFPVLDSSDPMLKALGGEACQDDSFVDAYGSWQSVYYPIRDSQNKVVAIIDCSESKYLLSRFRDAVFYKTVRIVLILTLLTMAVCLMFSHRMTRSLTELTTGASRIAGGDLETRLPASGTSDEIGLLVHTFNDMVSQLFQSKTALDKKIFELSALYDITRQINFAKDTGELLKAILNKTVSTMNSEKGCIWLYDKEKEVLLPQVCQVRKADGVADSTSVPDSPSREALEVFNSMKGALKPDHLYSPLVSDNRTLGLIEICREESEDFNENDLTLLSTLSSLIAQTLEKARLYEMAITDGMTGLYVHRYFQLALQNEIDRSKRYGKTLSLIMFDIDHFKNFNDTYGHQIGDIVITETATILKGTLRSIDLASRYGGEEFTVILPETEGAAALNVAERLRKLIEAHEYSGYKEPLKVTISLGISVYPEHSLERLDLIRKADTALYHSKENGRNCATVYQESFDAK